MSGVRIDLQNDKTWATQDGRVIPIEEMTPEHRGNCVRMIERKAHMFAEAQSLRLLMYVASKDHVKDSEAARLAENMAYELVDYDWAQLDYVRNTPAVKRMLELGIV